MASQKTTQKSYSNAVLGYKHLSVPDGLIGLLVCNEALPRLNGWILGATYDPYRKELYVAQKDQGVTRNGEPIKVSSKTNLDPGTRICTSNSYEGGTWANLEKYEKLGDVWVDVLGSAVLI